MNISIITLLPFLLVSINGCSPLGGMNKQAFKEHFDRLHGYDVCGEGDIECLQAHGWRLEKSSIEVVEELLNKTTNRKNLYGRQLQNIMEKAQLGDEVWIFSTPPASWEALMGASGYMVVRNKEKIAELWTARD